MDSKNLSKLAIVLSSVSILLIFYILSNAPQEQPDLSAKLEPIKLETQKLQQQYERLESDLSKLQSDFRQVYYDYLTRKYDNTVDFTTPGVQDIADGFKVVEASQEEHLTGIKFKGRVINAQSIVYENVTFLLSVNGQTRSFTINRISPGNSTGFNVYVPDLKAEDAQSAKIKFNDGSVRYFTR